MECPDTASLKDLMVHLNKPDVDLTALVVHCRHICATVYGEQNPDLTGVGVRP
jgi:hypothetical protein